MLAHFANERLQMGKRSLLLKRAGNSLKSHSLTHSRPFAPESYCGDARQIHVSLARVHTPSCMQHQQELAIIGAKFNRARLWCSRAGVMMLLHEQLCSNQLREKASVGTLRKDGMERGMM